MSLLESYLKSFTLSRIWPMLSRDVGRNVVEPTLFGFALSKFGNNGRLGGGLA